MSWSDLRPKGGARRRAAALGVPFLLFGPGLLCAPPGWGTRTPILSVTAQAVTGPRSPIDILDPDRLLAGTGWENPALLARGGRLAARDRIAPPRRSVVEFGSRFRTAARQQPCIDPGRQQLGQCQWIDFPGAAQRHARGCQEPTAPHQPTCAWWLRALRPVAVCRAALLEDAAARGVHRPDSGTLDIWVKRWPEPKRSTRPAARPAFSHC